MQYPIIGLCGKAGTGKTEIAKTLSPNKTFTFFKSKNKFKPEIIWDHFWLSLPLYEIYNTRTKLQGDDLQNRILYGIDNIVREVTQRSIAYDDMIELVYDLYDLPILNREDEKPRSFLQQAGDLFLKLNTNSFIDYVLRRIQNEARRWEKDAEEYDVTGLIYVPIISDIRFIHEAKKIYDNEFGFLIKLTADEEVRNSRLQERDGGDLTSSEKAHRSETNVDEIPEEWYDIIVDTTNLTKSEQLEIVQDFVFNKIGIQNGKN